MELNELASKKVAILGVGIEGLAMADFLVGKCKDVTLLDAKSKQEIIDNLGHEQAQIFRKILKVPDYKTIFGKDYMQNLDKFEVIFRSPGVKYYSSEIQDAEMLGTQISSQIKLFFDLCPAKIIGVTGTKGKGTTSSLIYEILKKDFDKKSKNVYLAGNIGESAINLIGKIKQNDVVVLELSSFQLQDLHKSPDIACVLNITSDHLDYHKNDKEYFDAKLPIVKFQNKSNFAVINIDYLTSFEFSANTLAKVYYFSSRKFVDQGAFVRSMMTEDRKMYEVVLNINGTEQIICDESEVKIFGLHNLENIAAAALVSYLAGAGIQSIREGIKSFRGLPHRLEYVCDIDGVKIFNDSFATNPAPTLAAVKSFNNPKLLILGGSSKGADFNSFSKEITENNVKAVALIGNEAAKIKQSLLDNGYIGNIVEAGENLENAVDSMLYQAERGDILLFSPACASFDMFKNYKDRGDKFKNMIKLKSNKDQVL